MTFDQIEYFMSCASCLNFSLAAKYHYVSVSTLSRNISALEDELGVKLFRRGYHGHSLTKDGIRFFDFAESAIRELDRFWAGTEGYNAAGAELLRIACYPFDNMFGRVVECFSSLPSDYLGKKYKIQFVSPGTMIKAIRSGKVHMGIAASAELEPFGDEFSTIPFFNSAFSLRLLPGDRLEGESEISISRLLSMGLKYSDFLPDSYVEMLGGDRELLSEMQLLELGRLSQRYAPELIWHEKEAMESKYYLLPRTLEIPFLNRSIIPISGADVYMEFMFFQKNGGNAIPAQRLEVLKEHFARNIRFE